MLDRRDRRAPVGARGLSPLRKASRRGEAAPPFCLDPGAAAPSGSSGLFTSQAIAGRAAAARCTERGFGRGMRHVPLALPFILFARGQIRESPKPSSRRGRPADSSFSRAENEQCQFKMRRREVKQLELAACGGWGGPRPGTGPKRKPGRGPSHVRRPEHQARWPVHVTLRVVRGLPSLRAKRAFELLSIAFGRSGRAKFRPIEFSVQTDHVHLIVEADSTAALARGIQGLAGGCARALNRAWARRGRVWAHRYHAHPLKTPSETRNAFAYVLLNFCKHLHATPSIDPRSSGRAFDGWSHQYKPIPVGAVARPRTWLASVGWQRAGGLLDVRETPRRS